MCDSMVPRFMQQDKMLFMAIVGDLFPGLSLDKPVSHELWDAVSWSLTQGSLISVPAFIDKGVELFETLCIRFGVLSLGPTGGGKTALTYALRDALSSMAQRDHDNQNANHERGIKHTKIYCFNPKSISLAELYGSHSLATSEWTDGLAATIVRHANHDPSDDWRWVLFDGPVDAVWVESMNTVLDDNQTLCLPNSERIKLSSNLRMFFECGDVTHASPATVSRLGCVSVSAIPSVSHVSSVVFRTVDPLGCVSVSAILAISYVFLFSCSFSYCE